MITVVGDNALDMYWVGTCHSVSAEAPIPVTKVERVLTYPGMAGNVAAMIPGCTLLQPTHPHLAMKNRLVTPEGQQIARWDVEDYCYPLTPTDWERLPDSDAIIVCDYNKGAIDSLAVAKLRSLAESGTPLFVDTKRDPFMWLGVDVTLFPNRVEYSQFQSHYDWMPKVVLKKSAEGADYMEFGKVIDSTPVSNGSMCFGQKIPVVRNVCGAGDCVIAKWVSTKLVGGSNKYCLENAVWAASKYVERPFDQRYGSLQSHTSVA